jgi:hypothetical protein
VKDGDVLRAIRLDFNLKSSYHRVESRGWHNVFAIFRGEWKGLADNSDRMLWFTRYGNPRN